MPIVHHSDRALQVTLYPKRREAGGQRRPRGDKGDGGGQAAGVWQRRVVYFERNVLSHVPAASMAGVTEDLKAIFKARRQKTAWALAEEFVELYGGRFPKVRRWFGCSRRG